MRRTRPRPRPARLVAVGSALAFLLLTTLARGQEASSDANTLARYVPKDELVVYFEFDGLDAHADAWKKTAAYKILNTTTAGAMLEDLFVQVIDKLPGAAMSGADALAMLKHVARSGLVLAAGGDFRKDKPDYVLFALRGVFKNKAVSPIFARRLVAMNAPTSKPQAVVRAGHKVISGLQHDGKTTYSWWVEDSKKEDLVIVLPSPESADFILETLDGKRPNAVDHPRRAELAKGAGGFVPTGLAFLDPVVFRDAKIPPALGLSEIQKLDMRWGFQDDAMMSELRVSSPSPRKGVLALLDGPTFEKSTLPPLPESLTGFTVMSADLKTTLDKVEALVKMASPEAGKGFRDAVDGVQSKTKVRLREDILAHLGPKVAWYILPSKAVATPPASAGMLGMMMAGIGMDQVPKLALVFDVDDPAAFGKVLDELMAYANREFKSQVVKPAGGAGEGPARGNRPRASGSPTFEFRLMPGENKTYVLSVPTEMASMFPATLRPTIRVGSKYVVVAVSSEVARLALEAKGSWTPPSEVAGAFAGLSKKLKYLGVADPRDTTPATLATLPAKLQTTINTVLLRMTPPPPPGSPPPAAPGPAPGEPGGPGGRGRFQTPGMVGGPAPSAPGPQGVPGGPAPAAPPSGPPTVVFQVDAAKLPSADAIRALLFPTITSAEVTDEGIRIVVRQAFPSLGDPVQAGLISGMMASMMGRNMPPGASPFPPPGPPPAPGNASAPAPSVPGGRPGGAGPTPLRPD